MTNEEALDEIATKLTGYFGICSCQRKIKTIVDNLLSIYDKCSAFYNENKPLDFTGAEWLILALLDKNTDAVMHGINCEYPIIIEQDPLWVWLNEIRDSPALKDM